MTMQPPRDMREWAEMAEFMRFGGTPPAPYTPAGTMRRFTGLPAMVRCCRGIVGRQLQTPATTNHRDQGCRAGFIS